MTDVLRQLRSTAHTAGVEDRDARQPYRYRRVELVEPDWTRFPGWRDVTAEQWASAQWQRAHCVKNIAQLKAVLGDLVDDTFYADLATDQQRLATIDRKSVV